MTGNYCKKSFTHIFGTFWVFFEWFDFMVLEGAHLNPKSPSPLNHHQAKSEHKLTTNMHKKVLFALASHRKHDVNNHPKLMSGIVRIEF